MESVLRYGLPPSFATFVLKPHAKTEGKLRSKLAIAFASYGALGLASRGAGELQVDKFRPLGGSVYRAYAAFLPVLPHGM